MGKKEKRSMDEVAAIVEGDAEYDTLPKEKKKHKHKEQEKYSEEIVDYETVSDDSPNNELTKKKKKKRKHDIEATNKGSEDENEQVKKDKKRKHKHLETGEESERGEGTDNLDKLPKKEKKKKHKNREQYEETENIESIDDTNEEVNGDQGAEKKHKKKKKRDKNEESPESQDPIKSENDDTEKTPKKKKKRDKKVESSEPQGPTKSASSLEYLHKWKEDRDNWKFQTMRQVWLLQHMYDDSMIPDSDFDTMLEYVDSVKGKSRDLTLQKAQTMMQQHELAEGANEEDEETETGKDTPKGKLLNSVEYERVRQVIQLLL